MQRDGFSRQEAKDMLIEARKECLAAIDNGDDPEDVFMDLVGLEPDYLLDVIYYRA
jgi:hypothetical protein